MARFQQQKSIPQYWKYMISLLVFCIIAGSFYCGIDSLSIGTIKRQEDALRKALTRSITYCYAMEGFYPQDLEYIQENYGLTYDKSLFFVDYQVIGSNIFPEITIIHKER